MILDLNYEQAKAAAEAFKALGQTEVYLSEGPFPWHLAGRCEPGGSHRLDIATSVRFYGRDPETGLDLTWSFDIEPRDANGKGSYEIDAPACRRVLRQLSGEAAAGFRAYLGACAAKVRAKGDDYQSAADRQYADAAVLAELAKAEGA